MEHTPWYVLVCGYIFCRYADPCLLSVDTFSLRWYTYIMSADTFSCLQFLPPIFSSYCSGLIWPMSSGSQFSPIICAAMFMYLCHSLISCIWTGLSRKLGQGSSRGGGFLKASTVLIWRSMIREISVDPQPLNVSPFIVRTENYINWTYSHALLEVPC